MFAVIESNKNQYKVVESKQYKIDLLKKEIKEGEEIIFSDVLLIDSGGTVTIGSPKVEGAQVSVKVLGKIRQKKVVVSKFHSKKRYSRTAGERPEKLLIEIIKISVSARQPSLDGSAQNISEKKLAPKKVKQIKKDEK